MSYVLHIWSHPASIPWPDSVGEANRSLQSARGIRQENLALFPAFAARLTSKFPCICSPEAELLSEDEWAWIDGPLNGKTESHVYSIGLRTGMMLEEVQPFVIKQAQAAGLCVMDEQAGKAYLANGAVLTCQTKAALQAAPVNYDDVPKLSVVEPMIFERLMPFMAKHGYKPGKKGDGYLNFKTAFPNGWHEISLATLDRWPLHVEISLPVSSRFHAVSELIVEITKPKGSLEEYLKQRTTCLRHKDWMDGAGSLQGQEKEYLIISFSQIDSVVELIVKNLETRLLPLLKKYQTIEALDQLLNPVPVRKSMFFTDYLDVNHIIAAYLARNPRLEAMCEDFLLKLNGRFDYMGLVTRMKTCIEYVRSHPLPAKIE